jgi:hypothetical protein
MEIMMFRSVTLLALIACGDKDTDTDTQTDTDTDTTTDSVALSDYIYVTEAPVGELACFAGESGVEGHEIDNSVWLVQDVDPSLITIVSVSGEVIDFETDDPVEEGFLDVFFGNSLSGSSDASGTSAVDGSVSLDLQVCSPYTYRVYTDPALDETKVTIEKNTVESPSVTSAQFNSVSSATYRVIPSLLGVSPDPDKGIVAGTAFDCNGDSYEGAQVVVRDADGNIPESLVVKYFVDDFPNRNQEWTSEDGLWVAVNVPEGDWFVDTYVSDEAGGHIVKGTAEITVFADSINISNIHTGIGDGIKYPESCLASETQDPE